MMKYETIQFFSRPLLLLFFANVIFFNAGASVSLPGFFSDGMVLQRDQPIRVFGWGEPGEKIVIQLAGNTASVSTDKDGNWNKELPQLSAGGPYILVVEGTNKIIFNDVLIGDVWFCSGQSNMEWKMGWLEKEKQITAKFANKDIRLYEVHHQMGSKETTKVTGSTWNVCTPEQVLKFSAVATYFAQFLQKEINVPIGIIVSAWGGTDIEPWISSRKLGELEKHQDQLKKLSAIGDIGLFSSKITSVQKAWNDSLMRYDPGLLQGWHKQIFDDSLWLPIMLPGVWDTLGIVGEGVGWFRKEIQLTEEDSKENLLLSIAQVNNRAEVYFNGNKLDEPIKLGLFEVYPIASNLLTKGSNTIAIKVFKFWGKGGFTGKPEDLFITSKSKRISLAGSWKFHKGYITRNPGQVSGPNNFPSSLYNGMVNPFTHLSIKGIVWYQGENNTSRPNDYAWHLQALIKDWRTRWREPSLPFLLVQLPNFLPAADRTGNYNLIRAAQQEATILPNVYVAVTIDIGEALNIHPINKYDVGYRLFLLASKMVYGNNKAVAEGPMVSSIKSKGQQLIVSFTNLGAGLKSNDKYGYLKGFEIAGIDKKFYWAKAEISGNHVIVYNATVCRPMYLRYAWADNPEVSLFNVEGLPAPPFNLAAKE